MKHLLYLLFFTCFISCTLKTEQTQEIDNEEAEVEDTELTKGYEPYFSLSRAEADVIPTDTSQIASYDVKGVISVYPDSAWINQEQKSMDEATWNTIIEDYMYYEMEAIDTLESIGVKLLPESNMEKRYFKFRLSGNGDFYVDKYKIRDEFGIILYNGKDVPTFCYSIDVAAVMDSLMIDK